MYKLYKITNIVNGKSYIGFTKMSVQQRWAAHINSSKKPKYPIHFAIAKHGVENFTVDTIAIGSRQYITALEERAIQAFNSRANGYNIALGGCGGGLGLEALVKYQIPAVTGLSLFGTVFGPKQARGVPAKLTPRYLGLSGQQH